MSPNLDTHSSFDEKRLVLIDSRIDDLALFLECLSSNSDYIIFDYYHDTFDTLLFKIQKYSNAVTHVSIVRHNEDPDLKDVSFMANELGYQSENHNNPYWFYTWERFINFIGMIKLHLRFQTLDFISCNLLASKTWVYVISHLTHEFEINVRASYYEMGNGIYDVIDYLGNQVSIINDYFCPDKIGLYTHTFIGVDFIEVVRKKAPWAVYSAEKYGNNTLYDLTGNNRHATTSGLTAGSGTGNGATGSITNVSGNTNSYILFPSGSIPASFTMASITRWTGTNKKRILTSIDGSPPNVMMGHHQTGVGIVYANGSMVAASTSIVDTNWLNVVAKTGGTTPNNALINGVASGTGLSGSAGAISSGQLGVNKYGTEKSDFAFAYLIIWDQALTDAEMVIVSTAITDYLITGESLPYPTAFQNFLSAKPPWGIYRASDWVSGTKKLPEMRGITARDASGNAGGTFTYLASDVGNAAVRGITSLSMNTNSNLTWPAGSLPVNYTVAVITRITGPYGGSNYGRTLQAAATNWLLGHWGSAGNRGVFYSNTNWVNSNTVGTITNWVNIVGKYSSNPNNLIVDGTARGAAATVAISADKLAFNTGNYPTEYSNSAMSYIVVWDQVVTDAEAFIIGNEFASYLATGSVPGFTNSVFNGYFGFPSLTANSATEYTSSLSSVLNWNITRTNAWVYIANQSTSWGYNALPPGVTQWLIIQNTTASSTATIQQNVYLDLSGTYNLTYYVGVRPTKSAVQNITTSFGTASIPSYTGNASVWEKKSLYYNATAPGLQSISTTVSYSGTTVDTAVYLSAFNITYESITVPGAPTITSVTSTAFNQIQIYFTDSSNNGGASVTTHKYSIDGSTYIDAASTTSPITVNGISYGTYSVTLKSTNSAGDSTVSNSVNITIYATAPTAPTITSITGGYKQLSIAFTDGSANGAPITTHKYSINGNTLVNANTTISPFTIANLGSTSTTYSITLYSTNVIGDSSASIAVNGTTIDYPGPPTITSITNGIQRIYINFTPNAYTGGLTITNYKYSVNSGAYIAANTTSSPITIPLTPDASYSITLKATNSFGDSSASNVVTDYLPGVNYNIDKAFSIDWNGKMFVLTTRQETTIGGSGIGYLYSYDGYNWFSNTDISNSSILTDTGKNPYSTKWIGSGYAITGNLATQSGNTIMKSTDGLKFSSLPSSTPSIPIYDLETNLEMQHTITFPKNVTLALGGIAANANKIAYSTDEGITWTPANNSPFSVTANNATWNGKYWVAVGQGGNTIATSPDGKTWTGRGSYIFTSAGTSIAWSNEWARWCAGGKGLNSLAYSMDGVYWFGCGSALLSEVYDLKWNGYIWVAAGKPVTSGKSIAYSNDGITWALPSQSNLFDGSASELTWNGSFWVAFGNSSGANGNNIAISNDGIYWTPSYNDTYKSFPVGSVYSTNNETFIGSGSYVVTNTSNDYTSQNFIPAAPTNLARIASTTTSISFSFTGVSSVSYLTQSYIAYIGNLGNLVNTQSISYGTSTFTFSGLTSGLVYDISLVTVTQYNTTSTPATLTYGTILSPPTGLTGTSNTTTSITFSFTKSSGIVTNYSYSAVPTSGTTLTGTISSSASSYTITGMTSGAVYTITMAAINSYGTSASSAGLTYGTVLPTPTGLTVTNTGATTATISFTAPTTNVTTYTVSAIPASGTTITQTFSSGTSYTITGLVLGTFYTITLNATNAYGTSGTATTSGTTQSANSLTATGSYILQTSPSDSAYWMYIFTGNGTLSSTSIVDMSLNILAVGGGGGGALVSNFKSGAWGGGGGGGFISKTYDITSGAAETISFVIGAGGVNNTDPGGNGGNTTITYTNRTTLNRTAIGGGGGSGKNGSDGRSGGSGGGGLYWFFTGQTWNGGSTIPATDMSGFSSPSAGQLQSVYRDDTSSGGGGGGGASQSYNTKFKNGGNGKNSTLPGMVSTWYFGAGGGGGGRNDGGTGGLGGAGGGAGFWNGPVYSGGAGGANGGYLSLTGGSGSSGNGGSAVTNSGSGGGGCYSEDYNTRAGGTGGSGIVIITVLKSKVA